jgi:hypothetical protein
MNQLFRQAVQDVSDRAEPGHKTLSLAKRSHGVTCLVV